MYGPAEVASLFSLSDSELARETKLMLQGDGADKRDFLLMCRTNQEVVDRLMENSRAPCNSVLNLSIVHGCRELFDAIVISMSKRHHMRSPWTTGVVHQLVTGKRANWVADLDVPVMKWVLRETVTREPRSEGFIKNVVDLVIAKRGLQVFAREYNPLAHAIKEMRVTLYKALMLTALSQLKTVDGIPIIFNVVRETGDPAIMRVIWNDLVTESRLLESQVHGENLLIKAIRCEDIDLVKKLFNQHRETMFNLESDQTPLMEAVLTASIRMVSVIILEGYSPLMRNKKGLTPLQASFHGKCVWMVELMLGLVGDVYLYTLDNLFACMSAGRWWLARDIMEGIKSVTSNARNELVDHRDTYNCLELIIDANTTGIMLGRVSSDRVHDGRDPMRGWCQTGEPNVGNSKGRDWHGVFCGTAHTCSNLLHGTDYLL